MPLQGLDPESFLSAWCHTECGHLGLVSRHFIDHARASFGSKRRILTTEAVLMFFCLKVFFIIFSFIQPLSNFDVQFLNAVGDLLDLIPALFEYSARGRQCNVDSGGRGRYQWDMGHCSALIKVRART